jgi:hypothetical protein
MSLTAYRGSAAASRHEHIISTPVPIRAPPWLQAEYRIDPPGDRNVMTIRAAVKAEQ